MKYLMIIFALGGSALAADQYQLIMSKDDKLCEHMLSVYNQDLAANGVEQYKSGEFKTIEWQQVHYRYDRGVNSSVPRFMQVTRELTKLDVNNDGTPDLILRDFRSKYDFTVHTYFVLKEGQIDFSKIVTAEEFDRASSLLGGLHDLTWYELRALNSTSGQSEDDKKNNRRDYEMMNVDTVEPFVFDGVVYLSFRQLPKIDPDTMKDVSGWQYHVIARYRPGVVISQRTANPSEMLEDVCYLKRVYVND